MRKTHLIIGGYVKSKSDGEEHFVTAQQLTKLYGVNPEACVFVDAMNPETEERIIRMNKNLIILRPRFDGNYKLKPDGRPV